MPFCLWLPPPPGLPPRLMKLNINQLMQVPQKYREAPTIGPAVTLAALLGEAGAEVRTTDGCGCLTSAQIWEGRRDICVCYPGTGDVAA